MPFLVFDTETTGLPDFKLPADDPTQPRMAQLAAGLFQIESGPQPDTEPKLVELESFVALVKPDGWAMPTDLAEKLGQGLTTEYLTEYGEPIKGVLERFMELYHKCDELTAFGLAFDLKIMRGELRRAGMPDFYKEKPEFDVIHAAAKLCRLAPTNAMMATGRYTGKTPKLSEAAEILLGVTHDGAHDAEHDMRITARLYGVCRLHPDAQPKAKGPRVPRPPRPEAGPREQVPPRRPGNPADVF